MACLLTASSMPSVSIRSCNRHLLRALHGRGPSTFNSGSQRLLQQNCSWSRKEAHQIAISAQSAREQLETHRWKSCDLARKQSLYACTAGLHRPMLTTTRSTATRSEDSSPQSGKDGRSSHNEPVVLSNEPGKDASQSVQSSLRKLKTREDIYNLPNFLTVTRLVAAPTTAYLLIYDHNTAALCLFAYAGITDFIDGWLARRWKLSTVAGSVMDPMADKALMIILTATLAVKGALPLALATLILGRDASMSVAAIYYRWASLPAPKTFMRYWDFSLPSAEVRPTQISKQNTFLQLILIGSTLALPVVTANHHHLGLAHDFGLAGLDLHTAMTCLQVVVAATTAWSGLSYVFNTEAVRMLPLSKDGSVTGAKDRRGLIGRSIIGVTFGAIIILAATQMNEQIRQEMMEGADELKRHE